MTYGKPTGTFNELMAERAELLERIEKLKTAPRVVQIETSNALDARLAWLENAIADSCPVNSLLQKDDRQSTAYAQSGSYPTLGEIGTVAIVAVMFAIAGALQ
jgi:hypothetical protein